MTDLPLPGMTLTPLGWPLMAPAFLGCVSFALGNDEIVRAFERDTGYDLAAIRDARGIDMLIDEQSGRTQAVLAAFMDFVTREVWGQEGAA